MASARVIGGMTTGLTFVFCLCMMISASMGDRGLEEMLDSATDEETQREIQELLREVQSQLLSPRNVDCRCSGGECRCCHQITILAIFDKKGCVIMKYHKGSFTTSITFGSTKVFTHEISLKDLGPFCFSYIAVHFCLELSDVRRETGERAHACLAISAKVGWFKVATIPLGCFGVTKRSQGKMMKTNELRYLLAPLDEPVKMVGLSKDWVETRRDDPFAMDDDEWEMVVAKKPLIE